MFYVIVWLYPVILASFHSCIFSEDRLFLRRLAYVESRDGTDAKTYRAGYNGGIWQVNDIVFFLIPPSFFTQ